jgi:RHS repeat-associated protein
VVLVIQYRAGNKYQKRYPIGMLIQERTYTATVEGYRFGFNGMEKVDEVSGSGNAYDFGARIYDSRLGRWMSTDPLQKKYPSLSPYNFVANSPLQYIDADGREIIVTREKREGQKDLVKIYITGSIWDNTTEGLTKENAESIAHTVLEQAATVWSQEVGDAEIQLTSDFNYVESPADITGNDHIIRIVDVNGVEAVEDDDDGETKAAAATGGSTLFVESDYLTDRTEKEQTRTSGHEVGHLLGLTHPNTKETPEEQKAFYSEGEQKTKDNIMFQSNKTNSTKVNNKQVGFIEEKFKVESDEKE